MNKFFKLFSIFVVGLALVSCQQPNSEPPVLSSIEITTEPTKKEYYTGDSLDLTGMVVTATYNNETTADVTKDAILSGFDSSSAVDSQTITVTYGGQSAVFTVKILFSWVETPKQLPAGTDGTYGTEGTYVYFGVWPQDVVPEAEVAGLVLDENASTTIERGSFKYVKGLDGNYYVKCAENAYSPDYKYKDNKTVGQNGTNSRWFKVMPIKWRVADTDYKDADGTSQGKLLVAESILTGNVPYYEDEKNNRTIDSKTVDPSNYMHSQIRAYLNGYTYTGYDTTSSKNVEKSQWDNKGFLQTAFTSDVINNIRRTKVDNSVDSTTNYDTQNGTFGYSKYYICDPTEDKIFLLSEYEVTKYSKSTETYSSRGVGNSRIRVTTDFAKAIGAHQNTTDGYGGAWWTRSPSDKYGYYSFDICYDGAACCIDEVQLSPVGVVPALTISF